MSLFEDHFQALLDACGVRPQSRVLLLAEMESLEFVILMDKLGKAGELFLPDSDFLPERLDAIVGCPLSAAFEEIAPALRSGRKFLRPGGRIAVEVPSSPPCELLESVANEVGLGDLMRANARGLTDAEVDDLLPRDCLRQLERHDLVLMAEFPSPHDAVSAWFGDEDGPQIEVIARGLTSRLASIESVELPLRRVRLIGMR
ncbi:MAG: hypothetical protein AB7I19_09140 [Planctomycetota bacterium]